MIDANRIDRATFALGMGILADRFGRELKAPTLRVYYELLAEELDTEGFVRGCKHVVKREQFFPSVQQIIDAVAAGTDVGLSALRAFRAIADGDYPHADAIAKEAMLLCGLWGQLSDMHPGTRAQKERQFLDVYAALAREQRDAQQIGPWPTREQIERIAGRAVLQAGHGAPASGAGP